MGKSKDFTQFGSDVGTLEAALVDRMKDAKHLFAAGRWASSIALNLYAFEIALKVQICRRLELSALPIGFQLHEFDALLILSGLQRRVAELTADDPVKQSWDRMLGLSTRHLNELRYHPDNETNQTEARDVVNCLNDVNRGIIPWLATIS